MGRTAKINAKAVKQSKRKKWLTKGHGRVLRYVSTDETVVSVTKTGKLRAKKKGTCEIRISALNRIWAVDLEMHLDPYLIELVLGRLKELTQTAPKNH